MYTGSIAFFEGMEGFVPSDTDKVVFKKRNGCNLMIISKNKETTFSWNENLGKQGIKEHCLKYKNYEALCIFLVPEIAEYLEVTIEDIKELREYFHLCDAKHQYLATICDAYIKNNDFRLTATQRLEAYNLYRTTRGLPKISTTKSTETTEE
jgi:hypothetical protein